MTENGISREKMIALVINSRYSIDDQIAIIRQKETKPEEYAEFYEFAERVKVEVTAEYAARSDADADEKTEGV